MAKIKIEDLPVLEALSKEKVKNIFNGVFFKRRERVMSDLKNIVAATVNGKDVSLQEIFYSMKINGKLGFLRNAVSEILISHAVEREGVSVSDEELQKASDSFRQARRLHKTADTENWLKKNNMNIEDMEARLERGIGANKLKNKVTEDKAEKYFAENRLSFDSAKISRIVVEKEGLANELVSQINEEGADFYTLAREHSIENVSNADGGYTGVVNRKAMSPTMESAVFGAKDGDVVGPVKTDVGYYIINVEQIQLGELNDRTKAAINNRLFSSWLMEESKKAKIDFKLIDMI